MSEFKVGDKVRVLYGDNYRVPGEEGVVEALYDPLYSDGYNTDVRFETEDQDGDTTMSFRDNELELVTEDAVVLWERDLPEAFPVEDDPDTVVVEGLVFHRGVPGDHLWIGTQYIAAHRWFDANPNTAEQLARVMAGEDYLNPLEIARLLPAARRVLAAHDVVPKF